ncbi:MAG: hypothetical protein NC120_13320 [Ruminococcus sp.]|nr:hypothetical protein [Ruminococcus sp.]
MGLFDWFKKEVETAENKAYPQQPEMDTAYLLLMDGVREDASKAGEVIERAFGPATVDKIDQSSENAIPRHARALCL